MKRELTERQKEYSKYLRSQDWKDRRTVLADQWNNKCACCGGNNILQLHHLNYDSLGTETIYDVVLLCKGCHCDIHHNRLKIWILTESEQKAFTTLKEHLREFNVSIVTFVRKDKVS
jgi:phage terminase large subunit GpA-like protein